MCQHKYFHGRCRCEAKGVYCETGRRTRTYFVLSGSVLSVWPVVEESLSSGLSSREVKKEQRMQIIRVRTEEDLKIVGECFKYMVFVPLTTVFRSCGCFGTYSAKAF